MAIKNLNDEELNDIYDENIKDTIDNDYLLRDFDDDDISDNISDEINESDIEDLNIINEEIIDNSIDFEDESESELDIYFKYGTNNHKLDGKHSLKRDIILKGRLDENLTNIDPESSLNVIDFDIYDTGNIPFERGSIFDEESRNVEYNSNKRKLAEDIYTLLKNNTELDFKSNRRKPNKITFNNYYKMLLDNIDKQYTKSEIFVELSFYFTDNIFNMYKLLDKKYATMIIIELRDKGYLNSLNSINFI